ncbi:MAG: hypothetical protein FJ252_06345, partial [Phycisphaerae bacterium]|nr:hypothetical protein [Phycisphaerae bacterium]
MTTTSSAPRRASAGPADLPLPLGFSCSGIAAGIKKSGTPDLGLIVCAKGAVAAAMFTRNLVAA